MLYKLSFLKNLKYTFFKFFIYLELINKNVKFWRVKPSFFLFHSSVINFKRLSNKERSDFKLNDNLKQILIGTILGDVYMRRSSENSNSRIIFRQGSKNEEYLNHLYLLFQNYVLRPPVKYTIIDKKTKIPRFNYSFATMALPCFNEFYELFYKDNVKFIPQNISNLLTPVSLAY